MFARLVHLVIALSNGDLTERESRDEEKIDSHDNTDQNNGSGHLVILKLN